MKNSQKILEIFNQNSIYLGNGIIKLDSILNHQLEPSFINNIAAIISQEFLNSKYSKITKVLTAEASGIAPAFCVANILEVPLVYARKNLPITMSSDHASSLVRSRTKGTETLFTVSKEFLTSEDSVLIVDDILGSGGAMNGLIEIANQCGSQVVGLACVMEKAFEKARERFMQLGIPVFSVVKVSLENNKLKFYN